MQRMTCHSLTLWCRMPFRDLFFVRQKTEAGFSHWKGLKCTKTLHPETTGVCTWDKSTREENSPCSQCEVLRVLQHDMYAAFFNAHFPDRTCEDDDEALDSKLHFPPFILCRVGVARVSIVSVLSRSLFIPFRLILGFGYREKTKRVFYRGKRENDENNKQRKENSTDETWINK